MRDGAQRMMDCDTDPLGLLVLTRLTVTLYSDCISHSNVREHCLLISYKTPLIGVPETSVLRLPSRDYSASS